MDDDDALWMQSNLQYEEDLFSTNGSGSPGTCLDFDRRIRLVAHIARPVIATVGAFSSIVVIVILFVLRDYRRPGYRLVMYLMVSTFLVGISQAFGVLPLDRSANNIQVKSGWKGACAFFGYVDEMSAWMEHLVIAWITVFLLMLVFQRPYLHKVKYELAGLTVWLGIPLLICWIPFTQNAYGLAGLWCWISVSNENCTAHDPGIAYQFALYYIPFAVLVLFNATSFLVIALSMCKRSLTAGGGSDDTLSANAAASFSSVHRQALKQTLPLLFYPILYIALLAFAIANRIVYAVDVRRGSRPNYPLWIVHIVVDSGRALYPPVAFLLHPGTFRSIYNAIRGRSGKGRGETTANQTAYVVRNEFSDEFSDEGGKPLIVKGATPTCPSELADFSGTYLAVN